MNIQNIYQFNAITAFGAEISLSKYKGKVVLIVNTASECNFTPQLKELQELYESFSPDEFAILAFPSNDFGKQEPLQNEAIVQFCIKNFKVTFDIFSKINIRAAMAHPLFKFLRDKNLNGKIKSAPKWNFHKYLINKNGEVVDYFYPFTKPNSKKIIKNIIRCLKAPM